MLRYIEIAEARPGGLYEPLLAVVLLLVTVTVLPRRCYGGEKTPRRAIVLLLLFYWPVFVVSVGLGSWGRAGDVLLGVARLSLAVAVIRLSLIVLLDMILPRWRGHVIPRILREIVHGLVYLGGALLLLREAGLDAVSLLTTGTVVGAILGLSLQETLGNLFAGLAVQAQGPYKVGDWIAVEGGPSGRVLETNWRATRIVTLDNVQVVIPNAVMARAPFSNYNAPTRMYRVAWAFDLPWDIPPSQVQELARIAARSVSAPNAPAPNCLVTGWVNGRVRYEVLIYVDDMERQELALSSLLERLWADFHLHGITLRPSPMDLRLLRGKVDPTQAIELELERRAGALAALSFLAELGPDVRRRLAPTVTLRRYLPGDVIVEKDQVKTEVYVVVEGRLLVGTRLVEEGQALGTRAQLLGEPWPETAQVQEEAVVYVVDRGDLERVTERASV